MKHPLLMTMSEYLHSALAFITKPINIVNVSHPMYTQPPHYCGHDPSLLFDAESIEDLKTTPQYEQWVKDNRINIDGDEVYFHAADDEIVTFLYAVYR